MCLLNMSSSENCLLKSLAYLCFCPYVVSDFLRRHELAARQASLSFTIPQSLLTFMSIEMVMPSNHLILCVPFSSRPQSFPASGSFPMSQLFTVPKYWSFSFSIIPSNEYSGLISRWLNGNLRL